jgi:DNA (cytosine-5)-methyltransferase 1
MSLEQKACETPFQLRIPFLLGNADSDITYSAANLKDPTGTKLFYGSVDDLLKQALLGNPQNSELVPLPGDIDCLSAGSPCQGFSNLNSAKNNETGLKNQSLVASVAAYVDFYRPKYGILENVMAMAQKGRGRDEDVLSQLICAIVGMGYQLQLFVLDAWSCGSPQSRTRLFVAFAAPGLEPLEHPKLSHSHPPKVTDRGLGQLTNGQSFGRRIREKTPFEYVTAGEATKDLPRIGDGCTVRLIFILI